MESLDFEGLDTNICLDWLQNYFFEKFSAYAIAAAIAVINILQLAVFKIIVNFEKHHFISNNLTSLMLKMFTAQYMNIGCILLMIYADARHLDLPEDFPILQGSYKKFKPKWYKVVGSTICVTMLS